MLSFSMCKRLKRRSAFTEEELKMAIDYCVKHFGGKVVLWSSWHQHQLGLLAGNLNCSRWIASAIFRLNVKKQSLVSSLVSKKKEVISRVLEHYKDSQTVSDIATACKPLFRDPADAISPVDVMKIIFAAEMKKGKLSCIPDFIRGLQAGGEKPAWMSDEAHALALGVPPGTLDTPRSTEAHSNKFEAEVEWRLRLGSVGYTTQSAQEGGQGVKTPDFLTGGDDTVTLPGSLGGESLRFGTVEVKNFLVSLDALKKDSFMTQLTAYVKKWGHSLLICRSRTVEATAKLKELGVTLLTLEELKLCTFSR